MKLGELMKNTVSICLSIYNQEKIIEQILFGILSNASMNVKEFIINNHEDQLSFG